MGIVDYKSAIDYILSFSDFEQAGRFSDRPDLSLIQSLLASLDYPQHGRVTVHVTGSKGKGSVSAIVESILRRSGFRTGLFTSPHLHSICERIRIDGQSIAKTKFTRLAETLQLAVKAQAMPAPDRQFVTFDLLTTLAFLAFREMEVEVQVVEVGLGGRLDSTNVCDDTEVCVVTAISLEHTEILGDRVEAIAREKTAIVRPGSTLVMGPQPFPEAVAEVRRFVKDAGATLIEVDSDYHWTLLSQDLDGQSFRLDRSGSILDLQLPLLGEHQMENAATAVACIDALKRRGLVIPDRAILGGLANVRWPGRLEVLQKRPLILADSAHNRDSARRLRQCLLDLASGRPIWLIVGSSSGKDLEGLICELAPLAKEVVATCSGHSRALPKHKVAAILQTLGIKAAIEGSVHKALDRAVALSGPDSLICVTGSLFLVTEARECLLGISVASAWGES